MVGGDFNHSDAIPVIKKGALGAVGKNAGFADGNLAPGILNDGLLNDGGVAAGILNDGILNDGGVAAGILIVGILNDGGGIGRGVADGCVTAGVLIVGGGIGRGIADRVDPGSVGNDDGRLWRRIIGAMGGDGVTEMVNMDNPQAIIGPIGARGRVAGKGQDIFFRQGATGQFGGNRGKNVTSVKTRADAIVIDVNPVPCALFCPPGNMFKKPVARADKKTPVGIDHNPRSA